MLIEGEDCGMSRVRKYQCTTESFLIGVPLQFKELFQHKLCYKSEQIIVWAGEVRTVSVENSTFRDFSENGLKCEMKLE